ASEGVAFRITLGANARADPRWLLPLICRRGGVTRREVGAIRIGPHETMFEIAGGAAHPLALPPRQPHAPARPARRAVARRPRASSARPDAPPAHTRPAPRAPEAPRLPGGYHPLQRRVPRQ